MVPGFDGPELNQFKDSHRFKRLRNFEAGSVRHVLEDFVVVINRNSSRSRAGIAIPTPDHRRWN